jgi:hypothetical protein
MNELFIQKRRNVMSQIDEVKLQIEKVRSKLLVDLLINGLLPVILYALLRTLFMSDVIALAIAGLVPAVRTIALWLQRRRVDWIGVLSILSIALALIVSQLSGGSALPLKLHSAVIAGVVGLVFIASVVIKKPLLVLLFQIFARNNTRLSSVENSPLSHKRLAVITVVIGIALFAKAAIDVILAFTLSTEAFFALSRVVNWAILGSGLAFLWLTRGRDSSAIDS